MNIKTMAMLRKIGEQLDQNSFPQVYDGGVIWPDESTVIPLNQGTELNNVKWQPTRPTTATGQWATRRARQARRRRSPSNASSFVDASLQERYTEELGAVRSAYPNTKIWQQAEGLWLLTSSSILPDLNKKATFLTAIPFNPKIPVRSWAFWSTSVSNEWIGPRHTNFPCGSICAFEPMDNTWVAGDSIIDLLDIYSVWALRHLHLEVFGKWAGYQSVPHPYERLIEIQDHEYCGCNNSNKLYKDCCKKEDVNRDRGADFKSFTSTYGHIRRPPQSIIKFMQDRKTLPTISELFYGNG